MDTLKAILNQILLFFDDVGERVKRMPAKGQRRVMLLCAIFLLLVILLLILCVSSCRSTGDALTSQTMDTGERTRVRGIVGSEPSSGKDSEGEANLPPEVALTADTPAPEVADPLGDDPLEADPSADAENAPEAAEETPRAQSTPAPEKTPEPEAKYATLKKHDKSAAVTSLQNRLMELGYLDIDEPTDYFGSSTETALILFQRI